MKIKTRVKAGEESTQPPPPPPKLNSLLMGIINNMR
jgi:hypothetical protein